MKWLLREGCVLQGSGMNNTVLELVDCSSDGWNCAVFSGWGTTALSFALWLRKTSN